MQRLRQYQMATQVMQSYFAEISPYISRKRSSEKFETPDAPPAKVASPRSQVPSDIETHSIAEGVVVVHESWSSLTFTRRRCFVDTGQALRPPP